MSEPSPSPVAGRAWLIPAAILLLAGLFPPETRPESLIGCAILCSLGALVLWVGRLDGARALVPLLVSASACGFVLTASSDGVLLMVWSHTVLAIAVGWVFFCLPKDLRTGPWLAGVLAVTGTLASLHAIYQRWWGLEALAQVIRQGAPVPDAELVLVRAEVGRAFAMFPTPAADLADLARMRGATGTMGEWRTRVRGAPAFNGEQPVACLAEEIATPGEGQVRGMISVAGNPCLSAPNQAALDAAFASLEFYAAAHN